MIALISKANIIHACNSVKTYVTLVARFWDKGMKRGYIRPTAWFTAASQKSAVLGAGVSERVIYEDKKAKVSNLPERALAIKSLRPGDVLVVAGLARLAVSKNDLMDVMTEIARMGAKVMDARTGVIADPDSANLVIEATKEWAGEARIPNRKVAKERGSLGGRPVIEPAMPEQEAKRLWFDPMLSGPEALLQMTGWSRSRAHRKLGPRTMRARSK